MTHVVQNKSFETAGTTLGSADQWTSTYLSTEELFGDFDRNQSQSPPDTIGHESFDEGWVAEGGNPIARPQPGAASIDQIFKYIYEYPTISDLTFFVFDALDQPSDYEDYEHKWRVTDPTRQAILWPGGAVQPDYQYSLTPVMQECDFNDATPNTFNAETFENYRTLNVGWYGSATEFIEKFTSSDIKFASFKGSGHDEDFEKWPDGTYSALYDQYPINLGPFTPFGYLEGFNLALSGTFGAGSDPDNPDNDFIEYRVEETFEYVRPKIKLSSVDTTANTIKLESKHLFDVARESITFEIEEGASLPEPLKTEPVQYLAIEISAKTISVLYSEDEFVYLTTGIRNGKCYMHTNPRKYWDRLLDYSPQNPE